MGTQVGLSRVSRMNVELPSMWIQYGEPIQYRYAR